MHDSYSREYRNDSVGVMTETIPNLVVNLHQGVEKRHQDGGLNYDKKKSQSRRKRTESKNP